MRPRQRSIAVRLDQVEQLDVGPPRAPGSFLSRIVYSCGCGIALTAIGRETGRELLDQRQRAGMGLRFLAHRAFGHGGSMSRLHRGWHPAQCCDMRSLSYVLIPTEVARGSGMISPAIPI